jgi:hypothetical protein
MAMVLMGDNVSGSRLRKEQEIPTNTTTIVASPSFNNTQPPVETEPPVFNEPQNPNETPFIIPEDPSNGGGR